MPVRQTKIFFLEIDSEFKQTHKWAVEAQVLWLSQFCLETFNADVIKLCHSHNVSQ